MSKVLVDRELPEPYGWIAVGELYMIRENAIRAAGKTSCIGVYTRPQLLAALSAVTAERDRLREEVERIALENDGHDQRRIRWAEELKQLRAEVERLREAELLLLSVCNDLMRHENADVRMVTCIELNNWLTRRAAMDAKEGV